MDLTIQWEYKTKNGTTTTLQSDSLGAEQALFLAQDMELTGRVKKLTLTDEHGSTWTIKELKKYLRELEEEPHQVTVYFDGNYDRYDKVAGLGIVIYYKQNGTKYRFRKNAQFDYIESNNEAEYAALSFAIDQCVELGVYGQKIKVYGDSQVVIHQMNDDWAMYEKDLMHWADQIEAQLTKHQLTVSYHHLSRNENKEADQLATQALQNIPIEATSKQ